MDDQPKSIVGPESVELRLPDKVVEIRCSICGKVGGTITFPGERYDIDESKHAVEHGLVDDHRCDDHKV